jgi:hypothetical protein
MPAIDADVDVDRSRRARARARDDVPLSKRRRGVYFWRQLLSAFIL